MEPSKEEMRQHHIQKLVAARPNPDDSLSNVLMLSLAHLSADTRKKLQHNQLDISGAVVYNISRAAEECILYIVDLKQAVSEAPYDLAACMVYANDLHCNLIAFDRSRGFLSPVLNCMDTTALPHKRLSMLDLSKTTVHKSIMLTISTAHISESTNNLLQHVWNQGHQYPRNWHLLSDKNGYGWILSIDLPAAEQSVFLHDTELELPNDLCQCMMLAIARGCRWLCLDSDGYVVPYLPIKQIDEVHI